MHSTMHNGTCIVSEARHETNYISCIYLHQQRGDSGIEEMSVLLHSAYGTQFLCKSTPSIWGNRHPGSPANA